MHDQIAAPHAVLHPTHRAHNATRHTMIPCRAGLSVIPVTSRCDPRQPGYPPIHLAVAQSEAVVMKGNLRRVIRHARAAETYGVGARALKIVQPAAEIEIGGILVGQRELRPPHRFSDPRWGGSRRRCRAFGGLKEMRIGGRDRSGDGSGFQKISTGVSRRRRRVGRLLPRYCS